jgi:hypothetical protein
MVETSSVPSASSSKIEDAACTRVIPFPGFRRRESRERLGSLFRYRRDSAASTSSIGSVHKRARVPPMGSCDELTVCDGPGCADAGGYETTFWSMSKTGACSRHDVGHMDLVGRECDAEKTRPKGYTVVCHTARSEAVSRVLGRLQDCGGWEEASHVNLALHRSAKAIVRHTWRDIRMSRSKQDAAFIERKVGRGIWKSVGRLCEDTHLHVWVRRRAVQSGRAITHGVRRSVAHDEHTLRYAQEIDSRYEIAPNFQ